VQLRVCGSSTAVGELAARIQRMPGSRHVIRSGDGSVGQALVTADLVDDAVDSSLECVRQMGVPSKGVMSVRLDAIGRSFARQPFPWADLQSGRPQRAPVFSPPTFTVAAGVIAAFGVIYQNSTLVVGALAISPGASMTLPTEGSAGSPAECWGERRRERRAAR
jgi:hypothetical protein